MKHILVVLFELNPGAGVNRQNSKGTVTNTHHLQRTPRLSANTHTPQSRLRLWSASAECVLSEWAGQHSGPPSSPLHVGGSD